MSDHEETEGAATDEEALEKEDGPGEEAIPDVIVPDLDDENEF